MENLIIKIFETVKSKPDQVITIPIAKLNVGRQLLPVKAKSLLEREAIDISIVGELVSKSISKGSLIENELPRSPDERDLRFAPTSYGVSIGSYHNASRGGELVRLRRIKPLSASGGLVRLRRIEE